MLNAVERESHTVASLDEDAEMSRLECLLACASSVEEQVEREQLKRAIRQAIGALPPRQRVAAVQRYYLDMSELGCSILIGLHQVFHKC
jgi:DNA-directed RNA polymerase specialized sigma24 family protein